MLVRILRRATLDEVQKRIKDYEIEQGMSFDRFEELFLQKKANRRLQGVYSELTSLIHAYRAYVEGGK